MKCPILKIAAVVMIILLSGIGASHAADLKDGFLGLPWRADLSASPDFVKIDEQNGVQNFIRPSVIHAVGDVDIFPVIYSCFASEFFAVYFENDIIVFSRLRNYFNQKYGSFKTTTRLNPRRTTNTWNHHDVEITLKLNRETGKLKLSFYYTPLSAKVDRIRLEAYQENTRSFLDRINKDRAVEVLDMMR
jgi:hypothetical protein